MVKIVNRRQGYSISGSTWNIKDTEKRVDTMLRIGHSPVARVFKEKNRYTGEEHLIELKLEEPIRHYRFMSLTDNTRKRLIGHLVLSGVDIKAGVW